MKKNLDSLIKKYIEIKREGFIQASNNNNNASGETLEKRLGSTGGDFNIPDFYGIEVKTIKNRKNTVMTLFCSTPNGKYVEASKWLSDKYGYPDKDYRNIKVFKGNIFGNKFSNVGLFYSYKLKVDWEREKIVLQIKNSNGKLINEDIYWDFDKIEEMLIRKMENLAIFKSDMIKSNGSKYIAFPEMHIYYLKSFEVFVKLIESGVVYLTINTGVHKSGYYKGKFVNHGCSWRINIDNIELLYEKVY